MKTRLKWVVLKQELIPKVGENWESNCVDTLAVSVGWKPALLESYASSGGTSIMVKIGY
jgi:hypothetical protein